MPTVNISDRALSSAPGGKLDAMAEGIEAKADADVFKVQMSARERLIAFIVMTVGMFMASLDIQIVASSIREIQGGLSATSDEISLVQTSYLIAEVIMIPMSGWLSRMLSTRWLFTISAAGFTLASLGCACAWNIQSMVVFRAIQGFVGGAMIPTVFAAGFSMFEKDRTRIPAVLGLIATLAPALGPSIGGFITDSLSWRWLFFINLVPGVLISIIIPRILRIDRPDFSLMKRFDALGVLFLALFLGCLQYFLEEGPKHGWLDDASMRLWFFVSAFSGVLFVCRCLIYDDPIVDLTAFRSRNFTLGCMLSFIIGVGLYGSIYLAPVFLGSIRGYNALQIGSTVFVVGLFNILATPFTVAMITRVDIRALLLFGFSLFALSCLMFSRVDSSWGAGEIMIPQMLRGFATLVCIIPVTGVALGALSGDQVKGGSGLYNLMRNLGGAIGLAAINSSLFYDRMNHHLQHLADHIQAGGAVIAQRSAALEQALSSRIPDPAMVTLAAQKLVARMAGREAFVCSLGDVFLVMAAVFCAALLLIPLIDVKKFAEGANITRDEVAH